MNILLLKGYNNFFNRILKIEDTVADYKAAVVEGNLLNYVDLTSINFNPNDGVTTQLIVGTGNLVWDHPESDNREGPYSPDYCIAYNDNGIHSRWFILECERTRDGQYKIALKRDILADYKEKVLNSPCFVEKGTITDVNDPLLLNAEGMRFNQIKNKEDLIKDNSKCAWLVGYVKKNIANDDLTNVNPINYTSPSASADIPSADDYDWADCIEYFDTTGQSITINPKKCFYFYNTDISFRTWYEPRFSAVIGNVRKKFTENFQQLYSSTDYPNENWGTLNSCAFNITGKVNNAEASSLAGRVMTVSRDNEDVRNKFRTMISAGKTAQFNADTVLIDEDIYNYNGKQVAKDGHIYRLEISPGQSETIQKDFTGNDAAANSWMTSVAGNIQNLSYNTDNPNRNKIHLDFRGKSFTIIAREVLLNETISFNFPVSTSRNNCSDAQYDMFCMPVDPSVFGLSVSSEPVVILNDEEVIDLSAISEMQLAISTILSTKLGANSGGALNYDLQLLPYCPVEELNIYFENTTYGPTYKKTVLDITNLTSVDYTLIYNNDETPVPLGLILYPKKANFSKVIDFVDPNETVHHEIQEVVNPIFTYNNQSHDGLPVWRFANFPYKVTDGVSDLDIEEAILPDIIVEAEYKSLTVSTGLESPQLLFTSNNMPLNPVPGQKETIEGVLGVKAHWILPDRPIDVKIKNECDLYRLSSPNFNSMYEFKKTKLRNGILSFNVDCTYKPFSPYIKVNPNYDDSLYSVQDFNDNMGLILSGDFSIPMLSDAWVNYELSNRNYQAIFNRQIQNLDVNMQVAKEQQQFQAVVGTLTGGIGGAVGGALAGSKAGPYGAIAGAIAGGVTGIVGGAAGGALDMQWLERQQKEARQYSIDQFNYQLGTTQALNATVTKSTPLTYNHKVWPILEYFTCTDKEKEVLENKIKYDGMTVMAIGNLASYSVADGYLKGKMIRIENLKEDFHLADTIYQEVDKGFYIKGE